MLGRATPRYPQKRIKKNHHTNKKSSKTLHTQGHTFSFLILKIRTRQVKVAKNKAAVFASGTSEALETRFCLADSFTPHQRKGGPRKNAKIVVEQARATEQYHEETRYVLFKRSSLRTSSVT